ncbi:unnamed protein product [Cladocopium goreaui]|uniref:Tyrosine specific protein phosphatases domain-containing protein n=1 Tax=Cladocopium goreaui TaxID=2562237 RepID=A0A9P1DA60_9DINO|nr:unnamed protein product [Cladocopium goreaui]
MISLLHWANRQVSSGRLLVIHCKCGRNRSPALCSVIAAWMASTSIRTKEEHYMKLRTPRTQASWATISSAFLMNWANAQIRAGRKPLVHCKCGKNRSPALAAVLAGWMSGASIQPEASWATSGNFQFLQVNCHVSSVPLEIAS